MGRKAKDMRGYEYGDYIVTARLYGNYNQAHWVLTCKHCGATVHHSGGNIRECAVSQECKNVHTHATA